MKEYLVQNQIFTMCQNAKTKDRGQRFFNIVPNILFFDWESDVLVMDNADRMFEFEIKASRNDLLKDFDAKKDKHKALKQRKGRIPNFFYFVVAVGEYDENDIPEYAGCYTFRHYNCSERGDVIELFLQKAAPILTYQTFGLTDSRKLLQSVYFKYWRGRVGNEAFRYG